jgi:hypothetical protein
MASSTKRQASRSTESGRPYLSELRYFSALTAPQQFSVPILPEPKGRRERIAGSPAILFRFYFVPGGHVLVSPTTLEL